ncbi:MAG: hypothetical protein EP347_02785 [Alphaproteobacteria bacterium]|nr:MAG: hypothetical protein EP347_02785 [Alphaproteobacteria bacterium]
MRFNRRILAVFLGVLVFSWSHGAAVAEVEAEGLSSPEATIAGFNAAIVEAINTPEEAGFDVRQAIMRDAVGEAFDMPVLARRTMSRTVWSSWSSDQKRLYVETLQSYQAAVLADRFKPGADVTFEIDGVENSVQGTKLVKTRILRPDDEDVKLNYLTAHREALWRVVDIYLNSTISEVAMRRSEYSAIVAEQGFDGLIAALNAQIEAIVMSHAMTGQGASPSQELPAALAE